MEHNSNRLKETQREKWIDILRIILTILVVVGHSGNYSITTAFGGVDYGKMLDDAGILDTTIHRGFQVIVKWIYSFHMPVFIALSGILFEKELQKKKYASLLNLVIIKGKRLLIPCFCVWIFWNIPIKLISNYYMGVSAVGIFAQIILCRNVYLWFLEALFFSFIICFLINKYLKSDIEQLILLLLLCMTGIYGEKKLYYFIPLGNPFKYSIWLWVGMRWWKIQGYMEIKKIWKGIFAFGAVVLETILFFAARYGYISHTIILNTTINPFLMFITLVYLSKWIEKRIMETRFATITDIISPFSFGVYLYSDPVNYIILFVLFGRFLPTWFGNELFSLGIILARIIIPAWIAINITKIIKKYNIMYLS